MTMKSTSYTALLLANLAVALPIGAFAQTQTPVGGSGASASSPATETPTAKAKAPAPKSASMKTMSSTDRVEQHITALHTQLRITPAQQPQWDQFAQVMRDNAKDMQQTLQDRNAKFATMTAVDNMQSYAQIAQLHAQDTQKLAAAFQTLYSSLTDDQKKNADTVFLAQGEHHGHKKG
jgi:protein CpxP